MLNWSVVFVWSMSWLMGQEIVARGIFYLNLWVKMHENVYYSGVRLHIVFGMVVGSELSRCCAVSPPRIGAYRRHVLYSGITTSIELKAALVRVHLHCWLRGRMTVLKWVAYGVATIFLISLENFKSYRQDWFLWNWPLKGLNTFFPFSLTLILFSLRGAREEMRNIHNAIACDMYNILF